MDERVVLNVGGNKFEVSIQTLQRIPDSLLGKLFDPENPQDTIKPDKNGEYFFDRYGLDLSPLKLNGFANINYPQKRANFWTYFGYI